MEARLDEREMEIEGSEFKQALANLEHLQSKFSLKINELKALRHSIIDAVAQSQVSNQDQTRIQTELENLADLRQKSQVSLDAFIGSFAENHFMEVSGARKLAATNLNASFDIQTNLEILKRKVERKLHAQVEKDEDKHEKEKQNEMEDGILDNDEGEKVDDDEETKSYLPLTRIAFGLLIVITFYAFLGGVINIFHDNNQDSKNKGIGIFIDCMRQAYNSYTLQLRQ